MKKNSEAARKMSYSIDLKKRVVDYVENGGRIAQAAGLFQALGQRYIGGWAGLTLEPQR
jgi:putative transposase